MRYRVAKHKRGFVAVVYHDGGRRQRIALKAADKFQATAEAAELVGHIQQRKPRQRLTVGQIVEMYLEQSEAIWKEIDRHHSKAILAAFGLLGASDVDSFSERRIRDFSASHKGKPGTIRKELSILRAALNWAERKSLIDKAPHIWLPQAPPPRDRRLSREEFDRLDAACERTHHLRLFVWLARFTAARAGAILSLRWDRCDFENRRIVLGGVGRQKRRAVVPMHPSLAFALALSKEAAETEYVIEWAGKPVKSIKNAFRKAVLRAGLDKSVTPHVLRHTAQAWVAKHPQPHIITNRVVDHPEIVTEPMQ